MKSIQDAHHYISMWFNHKSLMTIKQTDSILQLFKLIITPPELQNPLILLTSHIFKRRADKKET